MKNLVALLFVIMFCSSLQAQEYEFFTGMQYYKMWNVHDGHNIEKHAASFQPMFGFSATNILKAEHPLRLEGEVFLIKRNYFIAGGGLGSGQTSNGTVRSTNLAMRIYAINKKIAKVLDFNLGVEINGVLRYKDVGTTEYWDMHTPPTVKETYTTSGKFRDNLGGGLIARLGYSIELKNNFSLTPHYRIYYGTANVLRNSIGLGILYKPNK